MGAYFLCGMFAPTPKPLQNAVCHLIYPLFATDAIFYVMIM